MKNASYLSLVLLTLVCISISCKDGVIIPQGEPCDFSSLPIDETFNYNFDTSFENAFIQSPRWESYEADIALVDGVGQLTANSNNSNILEAWKLFTRQMPYSKSWEISVDVNIPLFWNSNGGNEAQVGAGIFVGKPVDSGQSSKVYECNLAAINGGMRFVQAQLVANRLGGDPIDVQYEVLEQSKESGTLMIRFCDSDHSLGLYLDGNQIGESKIIDASGIDNWNLEEGDVMDVGIMGFAENTVITSHQPNLDNFSFNIYE